MRLKTFVVAILLVSLLSAVLSTTVTVATTPAHPPTQTLRGVQPQAASAGAWTLLGTQPPGRDSPGWVYDSRANVFIVFGGGTTGLATTNSTWSYNYTSSAWTNITPVVGPRGRALSSMVYDSRADRVVLFGGFNSTLVPFGDTWLFDYANDTWTNVTTGTDPSPRGAAAMSYDPVADKVILYGGFASPLVLTETWTYDLGTNAWAIQTPTGTPTQGFSPSMVYDSVAHGSLLFGGGTISGFNLVFSANTYLYDSAGNAWIHVVSTLSPPGRGGAGLAYDSADQVAILFGGAGGLPASTYRNDTWAYSSVSHSWANVSPVDSPAPRVDTVLAYDSVAGRTVLFGGSLTTGTSSDEAWSYDFGPAPPGAPRSLVAAAGANRVTLTWQAPASDGLSAITNYSIYRGTTSGGETLLKTIGTGLTYTDSAVTAGTTYYYQVSAVNAVGTGPKSNEAHATPTAPDTTPPVITINVPANNSVLGSLSVNVSGTASDNVALQKVEVSTDGTTWTQATGTTTWVATVTLQSGSNTIYARATDTSGNQATARVTVTVQLPLGGPFGSSTALVVGLIIVVVAVLAAVAFLLMRRRRKPQQPQAVALEAIAPQTPPPPPPMPPGPPPGGT